MIDKLTPQQKKQIPIYRDKWLEIGLSTDRINQKKAKENFIGFNKVVLGNKEQPIFIFMDSPLTGWFATLLLYAYFNKVGDIESQVWSQVWSQVRSQVESQVRSQVKDFVFPYLAGNFWAGYFGFYDFCNRVLGIQFQTQKEWDLLLKTSDVNLIYPFKEFVVISQKPTNIKIKNNVLHNESGASVKYADGFELYSLNGVRISKELVMTPAEKLDPHLIVKETNAEVRREIVRKIGIERVCQKLGSKTLESRWGYELLTLDLGDNRTRPYLKMINPSTGTYHLEGIEPSITTVEQALAWRNGEKKFEEPLILT